MKFDVLQGDCREVMKSLAGCSVDAVVTDPPYELGFMGKGWDRSGIAYNVEVWRECLRVLKPGGHLLAFGGSRTYHRLACAIEDAGFEIRDQIQWIYGSGFPKSMNIGNGWGTALKPAHEPIVLARKPLIGTVAENVLQHGTGGLNIDGCRIESGQDHQDKCASVVGLQSNRNGNCFSEWRSEREDSYSPLGRWPANVIHDGSDEVLAGFPDAAPQCGSAKTTTHNSGMFGIGTPGQVFHDLTDSAARFFYTAKASKDDREEGLDDLPHRSAGEVTDRQDGSDGLNSPRAGAGRTNGSRNGHPTVKPTDLMRYLCRLITPPSGLVLDPFCGSGSTGKAAMLEGLRFIGIEKESEYVELAQRRIEIATRQLLLFGGE